MNTRMLLAKRRSAAEVHRVQFLENCTMHLHLRMAQYTWQVGGLSLARPILSTGAEKHANCTSRAASQGSKCRSAAVEMQTLRVMHFGTALREGAVRVGIPSDEARL